MLRRRAAILIQQFQLRSPCHLSVHYAASGSLYTVYTVLLLSLTFYLWRSFTSQRQRGNISANEYHSIHLKFTSNYSDSNKHKGTYTNRVRWANYTSSSSKFPAVYTRQKLWELVGSRQSYCSNNQAYFLANPVYCNLLHVTKSTAWQISWIPHSWKSDSAKSPLFSWN